MAGTKRNAGVMAALRLLGVGVLVLVLGVTSAGIVAAFDRDTALEFNLDYRQAHRHP